MTEYFRQTIFVILLVGVWHYNVSRNVSTVLYPLLALHHFRGMISSKVAMLYFYGGVIKLLFQKPDRESQVYFL